MWSPEVLGVVRGLRLGVVAAAVACSRRDAAPVEESDAPAAGRQLASASAFDLTPSPDGAVLAWIGPRGKLHVERFDAEARRLHWAEAAGVTAPIASPSAADLVAAATEGGVALAWTEAGEAGGRVRAAWLALASGAWRSDDLGPTRRPEPAGHGGLALAARGSDALLLARGDDTACASGAADAACAAFGFFRLSAAGAEPAGVPLSVPRPCTAHAAQLVTGFDLERGGGPGAFDYAVCSGSGGRSALTVFSIRPSPAYAMADRVFDGCTPLGAGLFAGEAAFVAACDGGRRMATVDARRGALVEHGLEQRGLLCGADGARVRFGAGWLRPAEPLGHLELLLTEDLAPPGARAVWTGAALLVARVEDGGLELSRHGCRGASLFDLGPPPDSGT